MDKHLLCRIGITSGVIATIIAAITSIGLYKDLIGGGACYIANLMFGGITSFWNAIPIWFIDGFVAVSIILILVIYPLFIINTIWYSHATKREIEWFKNISGDDIWLMLGGISLNIVGLMFITSAQNYIPVIIIGGNILIAVVYELISRKVCRIIFNKNGKNDVND